MVECQTLLNLDPRVPKEKIMDYYRRIDDLMRREKIPVDYRGFNPKTGIGIFEYCVSDCSQWVMINLRIEGDKGTMNVDGRWSERLEDKLRKIIPMDKHRVVQRAA